MPEEALTGSRQIPRFPEPPEALKRAPLLARQDLGWISNTIAAVPEGGAPGWWKASMAVSLGLVLLCGAMIAYLTTTGIGVWGVNHPVMWGWAIINFVWWIGIGHAGTLISAILFLLRQRWRTSVNRAAEAMTLFAVLCAGIFPLIHLGRSWFAWWLLPIPTSNSVWPQFRSPLVWDVFAVAAYFTVSLMFCYLGLLPDLASMRDRAKTRATQLGYGILALGWTGSNRHWHQYQKCYLLLAGLSTALVISVHSIVSLDFAVSQLPGWHSTLFPPYFVVGAVFSGLAMVLILILPLRRALKLEELITARHIDLVCKVALAASWLLAYAYAMEFISACFCGNALEKQRFLMNRAADPFLLGPLAGVETSPHWKAYWAMLGCNLVLPQLFWFRRFRASAVVVFGVAMAIAFGMWLERYLIVTASLQRDFLSPNWGEYSPTRIDILTFLGSFGVFFTLFLLFIRYFPMVAMAEVKGICAIPVSKSIPDARIHGPAASAPGVFAVLAVFDTPAAILRAARALHQRGVKHWDAFTPFPVAGMDHAMGLSESRIGWFSFLAGAAGFSLAMGAVWWTNSVNYPVIIGGKPMFSPWAAFPVAFETAILFAAAGAFLGMLGATRLPRWHHPLLKTRRFATSSHDRFILVVEKETPDHDLSEAIRCLQTTGASHLEWVRE